MKFTLHFRGKLPSNGNALQKHALREVFHLQLNALWSYPPLQDVARWVFDGEQQPNNFPLPFPLEVGAFAFVPLISKVYSATAELKIVLLRPEPPGQLITQGGDIDNRLKTLFDSLTVPQPNALPSGIRPSTNQTPYFHCLLHDDNLVTSVSVETAQLLEPHVDKNEVELYITVRTRTTTWGIGNSHLG